jgi:hypothetical protein
MKHGNAPARAAKSTTRAPMYMVDLICGVGSCSTGLSDTWRDTAGVAGVSRKARVSRTKQPVYRTSQRKPLEETHLLT